MQPVRAAARVGGREHGGARHRQGARRLYPDLRRYGLKVLLAIAPRILVLAPLAEEWSILVRASEERHRPETVLDLKLPCRYVPVWRMALAQGGHGKTQ